MSDLTATRGPGGGTGPTDPPRAAGTGGWILVGKEGEIEPLQMRALPLNQFNITHDRDLLFHDPVAFAKSAESLSLLIRDAAHVTVANFAPCVQCLRTYVEASLQGRQQQGSRCGDAGPGPVCPPGGVWDLRYIPKSHLLHERSSSAVSGGPGSGRRRRVKRREEGRRQPASATSREYDADESDSEAELPAGYHQIAIQLLDLMHTLHTRAAHIFGWFNTPTTPGGGGSGLERKQHDQRQGPQGQEQEQRQDGGQVDSLWEAGWCPLLQGIARLCCDSRKQVRASAVTYLQRSLLVHDLQALSPAEWEACFHKVLFPLLAKLLEPSPAAGMEETRMRAATLLCKVFLQHLTPLLSLPTFTALWLTILDFMDKYLQADRADLLHEAIPESMKNMLLVMETAGIFHTADGYTELWAITWDRIDTFLPSLREQVFSNHPPSEINKLPTSGSGGAAAGAGLDLRPAAPGSVGATAGAGGAAGVAGVAGVAATGGTAGGVAGASGVAAVGSGGTAELPTMAPSMREIRPASPLHHEELVTDAPSVILGPPLPAGPSPGVIGSPAPVAVPLMSLSAQPPAGPVFLQPLPPPGVAAPVTGLAVRGLAAPVPLPALAPPSAVPAAASGSPSSSAPAPSSAPPTPAPVVPVSGLASPVPNSVPGPVAVPSPASDPSLTPAAAAAASSDVTGQSAGGAVTSLAAGGLAVFRMQDSEGADDFLGR